MKTKKKARSTMAKKKDKHIAYDDPDNWMYDYKSSKGERENETEREEMVMSKKAQTVQ